MPVRLREEVQALLRWGDHKLTGTPTLSRVCSLLSKAVFCCNRHRRRPGHCKVIGWHTFRHTYSTLLIANGENVKVVQEIMCHASTPFTIEIYTQARIEAKRQAQQRLVQTILSEENDVAPEIQGRSDVTMT